MGLNRGVREAHSRRLISQSSVTLHQKSHCRFWDAFVITQDIPMHCQRKLCKRWDSRGRDDVAAKRHQQPPLRLGEARERRKIGSRRENAGGWETKPKISHLRLASLVPHYNPALETGAWGSSTRLLGPGSALKRIEEDEWRWGHPHHYWSWWAKFEPTSSLLSV